MKARINLVAALTVVAFAVSSFAPVSAVGQVTPNTPISKKEFKALLKTAKEPPEHRKVAE